MTSESKLRDETVRHRHSGATEFLALAEELGIDPGAMVDPRTELSFAMARRKCGTCPSKEECRQALRQRVVTLSEVAPFCPFVDLFADLLFRQPYGRRARADRRLSAHQMPSPTRSAVMSPWVGPIPPVVKT